MRREIFGNATLYLGDCRDILQTLQPPDAVIADPPYGMGYRSSYNSSRKGIGASMIRKDGNFKPIKGDFTPFDPTHLVALGVPTILWGANYYANMLPPSGCWLVWDKLAGKTPTPSSADVELAWTNVRSPSRMFTHLWRGIIRAGEENVANGRKLHPNQKPVALMDWCLGFVPSAKRITDPYMGSGSLGVACLRRSLEYVGIDNDPQHFETACRRLDDAANDVIKANVDQVEGKP